MLQLFKTLADSTRLRLLVILASGEFTVQELTAILGMGQSRISRHLKIMLDAGILTLKRQGTWSYYRLSLAEDFFRQIWPAIEERLTLLPDRERDLSALSHVLDERRQRSRSFFDHHARQWDDLVRRLLPTPDYQRELLELTSNHDPVVEVGIGTGKLLCEMWQPGRRLIGVDHSPAMLDEARAYLAKEGRPGIELRLGEMGHLPLGDGEAGCVVLNMVLHHAPNPAAVLTETARVLRQGGWLILADLRKHTEEWVRERLADQWLGFEGEDIEGWLLKAGFERLTYVGVETAAGQHPVLLLHAQKGAK